MQTLCRARSLALSCPLHFQLSQPWCRFVGSKVSASSMNLADVVTEACSPAAAIMLAAGGNFRPTLKSALRQTGCPSRPVQHSYDVIITGIARCCQHKRGTVVSIKEVARYRTARNTDGRVVPQTPVTGRAVAARIRTSIQLNAGGIVPYQ